MLSHRKRLLQHIDRALTIQLKRVVFGYDHPLPGRLSDCVKRGAHPCSRLMIPLTGSKRMLAAVDGKAGEITLRSGELIFTVPYGWTDERWDLKHTVLGIIFYNGYTRVIYIDNSRDRAKIFPDLVYHTARGMHACGWHVMQAMNKLAERREQQQSQNIRLARALLAETRAELAGDRDQPHGKAFATYAAIKEYLHANYHTVINRKTVAAALQLHPSYISRIFENFSGEGFNTYLNQLRMGHACNLLKDRRLTVGKIAAACGIPDLSYFNRVFKRRFGITPGDYRRRHQKIKTNGGGLNEA